MAATTAYPPGGTFLDTLKRSFVDVPVDAQQNVSTSEFLEAAESLTTLFGMCLFPSNSCRELANIGCLQMSSGP
jgi:hypothetical protein